MDSFNEGFGSAADFVVFGSIGVFGNISVSEAVFKAAFSSADAVFSPNTFVLDSGTSPRLYSSSIDALADSIAWKFEVDYYPAYASFCLFKNQSLTEKR